MGNVSERNDVINQLKIQFLIDENNYDNDVPNQNMTNTC